MVEKYYQNLYIAIKSFTNCNLKRSYVRLYDTQTSQAYHKAKALFKFTTAFTNCIKFTILYSRLLPRQKRVSSSRISQQTFNCSKSTTEATEKGVKYVKNYIDNRTTSLKSFWCLYCQLKRNLYHFSRVSVVDFVRLFVFVRD